MLGSGRPRQLAVTLALVVAACGGPSVTPSATSTAAPAPSASTIAGAPTPAPTIAPTNDVPTPTPSQPTELSFASPFDQGWANQFVMRVAVSGLNARDRPSTSAKSNGKAPKGGLFMMSDWPITANGYTWYYGYTLLTSVPGVVPDLPTAIVGGYDEVLVGWLATGTEDTPFLIPIAPRCPSVRDVVNLAAMLDSERLACFGSETIELEGTIKCSDCFGEVFAGTFEPDWLANPRELYDLSVNVDEALPLKVHFPPGGAALPAEGATVRVRGHFSDPRSATCRITVQLTDGGTKAIANAAAEQWCRGKFVVDSFAVVP